VSDHGEEFDEHGGWFHGLTLHRESLAVPLVIRDFRNPTTGVRVDEAVDLLDVPTTLLALAGVAKSPGMRGRMLLAANDAPLPPRDFVAELHPDPVFEAHLRPRLQSVAVARWPWKLIVGRDGSATAYRVDRDPAESIAIAANREVPEDVLRVATERAELAAAAAAAGAETPLDPETLDGLRALGYAE
jgi:arylsulfatase A-like enzyme